MKKLLFALIALVSLSACNKMKTYTISGEFDIPWEIALGDTVITRDPLDGMYVYLIDFNGEAIDSALVENEKFEFTGKMKAEDAFLAYIACEFSYGIVAVEPGEIGVSIGQEVVAYGTPANESINDIDTKISDLAMMFNNTLTLLLEHAEGEPSDSILIPLVSDFNDKCLFLLDSINESADNFLVNEYIEGIKNSLTGMSDQFDESDFILDEDFAIDEEPSLR